jgi:hypothetical protein
VSVSGAEWESEQLVNASASASAAPKSVEDMSLDLLAGLGSKKRCSSVFFKWFTFPLVLLCFPLFTLDVFYNNKLNTIPLVQHWYLMTSPVIKTRNKWGRLRLLLSRMKTWIFVVPLHLGIFAYQVYVVFFLWPEIGPNANLFKVLLWVALFIPLVVVLLSVYLNRNDPSYKNLDFPSASVRWSNWQNWVAILTVLYETFSMIGLLVPPIPYAESCTVLI